MVRKVLLLIVLLLLSGTAWAQERNPTDAAPASAQQKNPMELEQIVVTATTDGEGGIPGPGVHERCYPEGYRAEGDHGPGPGAQHPARRLRYAGQGAYGHSVEHQSERPTGPAADPGPPRRHASQQRVYGQRAVRRPGPGRYQPDRGRYAAPSPASTADTPWAAWSISSPGCPRKRRLP